MTASPSPTPVRVAPLSRTQLGLDASLSGSVVAASLASPQRGEFERQFSARQQNDSPTRAAAAASPRSRNQSPSPLSRQRSVAAAAVVAATSPDASPPRRFRLDAAVDPGVGFAKRVNCFIRIRPAVAAGDGAEASLRVFGVESGGIEVVDTRKQLLHQAHAAAAASSPRRRRPLAPAEVAAAASPPLVALAEARAHRFHFDRVFANDCSQAELYDETVAAGVDACLACRSSSFLLLCGGATYSGKSHSVIGASSAEEEGLLPRLLADLVSHSASGAVAVDLPLAVVAISAVEIYLEQVNDLLAGTELARGESATSPQRVTASAMLSGDAAVATLVPLTDAAQARSIVETIVASRASRRMAAHRSSRSHLVVVAHLFVSLDVGAGAAQQQLPTFRDIVKNLQQPKQQAASAEFATAPVPVRMVRVSTDGGEGTRVVPVAHSRITLADLAGSESLSGPGSAAAQEEVRTINQSLSALVHCVQALQKGGAVPSFRASALTTVLAPALSGSAAPAPAASNNSVSVASYHQQQQQRKTSAGTTSTPSHHSSTIVFVCCVSPDSYSATLNSLQFANSFKALAAASAAAAAAAAAASPTASAVANAEATQQRRFCATMLDFEHACAQVQRMLSDLDERSSVASGDEVADARTRRAARWLRLMAKPRNGVLRDHAQLATQSYRRCFGEESPEQDGQAAARDSSAAQQSREAAAKEFILLAAALGQSAAFASASEEGAPNAAAPAGDAAAAAAAAATAPFPNFFLASSAVDFYAHERVARARERRDAVRAERDAAVREREQQRARHGAAEEAWQREQGAPQATAAAVARPEGNPAADAVAALAQRRDALQQRLAVLAQNLLVAAQHQRDAERDRDDELAGINREKQQRRHSPSPQRGGVHLSVLQTTEAIRDHLARLGARVTARHKSCVLATDCAFERAKTAQAERDLLASVLSSPPSSSEPTQEPVTLDGGADSLLPWFLRPGQREVEWRCADPVREGHERTFLGADGEDAAESRAREIVPPAVLRDAAPASVGGASIGRAADLDDDDGGGFVTGRASEAHEQLVPPLLDDVAREHFGEDARMQRAFLAAYADAGSESLVDEQQRAKWREDAQRDQLQKQDARDETRARAVPLFPVAAAVEPSRDAQAARRPVVTTPPSRLVHHPSPFRQKPAASSPRSATLPVASGAQQAPAAAVAAAPAVATSSPPPSPVHQTPRRSLTPTLNLVRVSPFSSQSRSRSRAAGQSWSSGLRN